MKKILVVIDMQNDFINGSLGTKEAEGIVEYVVEKIKNYEVKGDQVYFTMDTHTPDYLQTQEGENLPVEHCIRGTKGWELEERIKALAEARKTTHPEEEVVFEKDIFGSEALAAYIREQVQEEKDIQIELVGLCTDICVLSNAMVLKTYMPQAHIYVDEKGCAGVTPESHANALAAMRMCQIYV